MMCTHLLGLRLMITALGDPCAGRMCNRAFALGVVHAVGRFCDVVRMLMFSVRRRSLPPAGRVAVEVKLRGSCQSDGSDLFGFRSLVAVTQEFPSLYGG
jgi:hypothetical protein